MLRLTLVCLVLLLPTVVLSACGETSEARLATAQQRWHATGITSYRITVEYILNSPFTGPRTLEVRNDVIVSQPQPCMREMYAECLGPLERAERYTVPGLFRIAKSEMSQPDRRLTVLEFDSKYGYPTEIDSNTTKALPDLTLRWHVISFVPLV